MKYYVCVYLGMYLVYILNLGVVLTDVNGVLGPDDVNTGGAFIS